MNRNEETFTSPVFSLAVPSDSTELAGVRSLYVTDTGNLNLVDQKGTTTLFPVVVGQTLPVQPRKVLLASTTASCILLF